MREILDEQDEIRREPNALKLQSELFRRRLNKLTTFHLADAT